MVWDINKVVLVGRLGNDPELKYTPNGKAVAKFSLAVGGKPKADGTDTVSFFQIEVWGKTAENAQKFISKGSQVCVDGHLEQSSWTAQDGTKRSMVKVVVERLEFLTPKKNAPNAQQNQPPAGDDQNYDLNEFDHDNGPD